MKTARLLGTCLILSGLAVPMIGAASATAAPATMVRQQPMNPPPGGAVITTYYSDAAHTTAVGQYLSSPCQNEDWGVRTSYYTVGFTNC